MEPNILNLNDDETELIVSNRNMETFAGESMQLAVLQSKLILKLNILSCIWSVIHKYHMCF